MQRATKPSFHDEKLALPVRFSMYSRLLLCDDDSEVLMLTTETEERMGEEEE